ncbi:MAG: methyltransferase domain-containing protein [Rhizomicrobium sp.]|jgi:hypothetical protein
MHISPEFALAERYSELLADRYYACDADPSRYSSKFTAVRPLDLSCDLVKLPSCSFDLIIHDHVLEHLRCDVEPVLLELERVLAPGGHHILSVPVGDDEPHGKSSGDLAATRIFGRRSLNEMLSRVWGASERHHIEPLELFSAAELETAAIPKDAWSGIGGRTFFHHERPRYRRTGMGASQSPPPAVTEMPGEASGGMNPTAFGRGGAKLIMHIGMPKTGTTSLQHWLATNRDAALKAGLDYWSTAENHSEAMFMSFVDAKRIAKRTMWFQRAATSPNTSSDAFRESFDQFLSGLGDRVGFISAEALWTFGPDDVRNLAAHLQRRHVQTVILCWIRPPADFLRAEAQQRCRTTFSVGDFGFPFGDKISINYRRLNPWLENFGRENLLVQRFGENVVAHLQRLLRTFGVQIEVPDGSEPHLNPSISLIAAKALLALNDFAKKGEKQVPGARLQGILRDIKGPGFHLPDSVLRRMKPTIAKEAEYLVQALSMDKDWLLAESVGVDDALFFHWDYDEVASLLGAVSEALSKRGGKKADGSGGGDG